MKILIIEDNQALVDTLKDLLEAEGFDVDYFYDLESIDDYIILNKYDLIILDLMLGDVNGLDFLKMAREEITRPIIILTAKNSKEDQLSGLGLGANDYITKPFDSDILLARIKSHLRNNLTEKVNYNRTEFDLSIGTISKDEKIAKLTNFELEIIKLLYSNRNKILSKSQMTSILSRQGDQASERTIVTHIYNIRKKILEIDGDDPIENKWGVGYRWKEV